MEKYGQPFCVIGSKGKFRGARFNHLPPLEYTHQDYTPELEGRVNDLEAISAEPGQMPRQYHDKLQQLQGKVIYLEGKLNEHIDLAKRRKQGVEL